MKEYKRNYTYDYLRILASFGVIILHLAAQMYDAINIYSSEWQALNFYDSIVRWTVPVFVMISGALFLSKDVPIKKIYLHYIPRLAAAYIFWSMVYSVAASAGDGFKEHKIIWQSGYFHMWYVPMCIGLYMLLPILKQITINKHVAYYYLLVSFIFAFLLPTVLSFTNDFGFQWMKSSNLVIKDFAANMNMKLVAGYSAYFVLGYFLGKIDLSPARRLFIYVLGLSGFLFTILATLFASYQKAKPVTYYDNFTVNVLLQSIAVFTAFRYMDFKNDKANMIAAHMAKCSFGAYLVHALIMETLSSVFHINTMTFNPGLSVPLLGCIIFAASYAISFILNRIPVVNRYVV